MIGVELADKATAEARAAALPGRRACIVLTCGPDGNVLRLIPPLTMTDAELDHGLEVLVHGPACPERCQGQSRRACFWILPVPPLGRSSRMTTDFGVLKGARRSRTHAMRAASSTCAARDEGDERARHLAPALVGHADDGRLPHRRVGLERLLHLHRRDVLAA